MYPLHVGIYQTHNLSISFPLIEYLGLNENGKKYEQACQGWLLARSHADHQHRNSALRGSRPNNEHGLPAQRKSLSKIIPYKLPKRHGQVPQNRLKPEMDRHGSHPEAYLLKTHGLTSGSSPPKMLFAMQFPRSLRLITWSLRNMACGAVVSVTRT
jgi:hypothetical protein